MLYGPANHPMAIPLVDRSHWTGTPCSEPLDYHSLSGTQRGSWDGLWRVGVKSHAYASLFTCMSLERHQVPTGLHPCSWSISMRRAGIAMEVIIITGHGILDLWCKA
jgi:hypothetical protein